MSIEDDDLDPTWPQCEKCYIANNSRWEPESVGDDGSLVSKLVAIAVPQKLVPGEINICATCGEITIAGIFVELDEDEVQYDEGTIGSIEEQDGDDLI